jgi:transposase
MTNYIGCDVHKKYSVFAGFDEAGGVLKPQRVENDKEGFRAFLESLPPGSPIAVETTGNWYWVIDEMERAGHVPLLAHAMKSKLMMGQTNQTDKLDSQGLARLLRNGTLPSVWIPRGELRDKRELPRMRLVLVRMRTALKNRIHATFTKYGIQFQSESDLFGSRGLQAMFKRMSELPPETRRSVEQELELLDDLARQTDRAEHRINEVIALTPDMVLLKTLPGVGPVLAITIALEVGDIGRFPDNTHLASYAGTVPRVSSSGGKTRFGRTRPDVNHYLKRAFIEAANVVVLNQGRWKDHHAVKLYQRIKANKGHAKAVVAVARHLAESAYWILKKKEPYREPVSSKQGERAARMSP